MLTQTAPGVETGISGTTAKHSVNLQIGQGKQVTTQSLPLRPIRRYPPQRPQAKAAQPFRSVLPSEELPLRGA